MPIQSIIGISAYPVYSRLDMQIFLYWIGIYAYLGINRKLFISLQYVILLNNQAANHCWLNLWQIELSECTILAY